jgi:hypothetical protein
VSIDRLVDAPAALVRGVPVAVAGQQRTGQLPGGPDGPGVRGGWIAGGPDHQHGRGAGRPRWSGRVRRRPGGRGSSPHRWPRARWCSCRARFGPRCRRTAVGGRTRPGLRLLQGEHRPRPAVPTAVETRGKPIQRRPGGEPAGASGAGSGAAVIRRSSAANRAFASAGEVPQVRAAPQDCRRLRSAAVNPAAWRRRAPGHPRRRARRPVTAEGASRRTWHPRTVP